MENCSDNSDPTSEIQENVTTQNLAVDRNDEISNGSSSVGNITAEFRAGSSIYEDSSIIQDQLSEYVDNGESQFDGSRYIEEVNSTDNISEYQEILHREVTVHENVTCRDDISEHNIILECRDNRPNEDVTFRDFTNYSQSTETYSEMAEDSIQEDRFNFRLNENMYWDTPDDQSEYNSSNYDSDDSNNIHETNIDDELYNFEFAKLKEMLDDESANVTCTNYFVVNKIEMILAIYKFAVKYSLPNIAIADLCRMINSFIDTPILPQSRYKLDKLMNPDDNNTYHAMCPICNNYVGIFDTTTRFKHCNICDKNINLKDPSFNQFFVTFNVESEIKQLLEYDEDYYNKIIAEREPNVNLQDIYDGVKYKEFLASLPDHKRDCYATSTFNSDGSPIFVSSSFSLWPIQLIINETQPSIRNKKPIICALWCGREKPNMTYFLKIFVENMNTLSENGIPCKIKDETKHIYLYCLCCCVDSVARAPMQGIKQFNGYYGCNWCLHPGKLVVHDKGKTVKYVLLDEIPALRTIEGTLRNMIETANSHKIVYGIRKVTPLINLQNFDVIEGFVPDAMHCIDLGITKQFCEYWMKSSNLPYSISKENIDIMNNLLISLKVPTRLARLSRSINERKQWKAKEWLNWILFYSLPLLHNTIDFPRKYIDHWSLLVEGYFILLSRSISETQLSRADFLLRKFVALTELLYGEDAMTFNVHQLSHLAKSVANWGPLWVHWGYPFESNNGKIVRTVHAAKGVLSQVCRRVSLKRCMAIVEKHVQKKEDSPVSNYCDYLENRCTKKTAKYGDIRYFGKKIRPNDTICEDLNIEKNNCWIFKRLVKNESIYKSALHKNYRSNNSYAQLENKDFVELQQFIVDEVNEKQYTVVRKINVTDCFGDISCTKKISHIYERSYIETDSIKTLCVVIEINEKRYITPMPHETWY